MSEIVGPFDRWGMFLLGLVFGGAIWPWVGVVIMCAYEELKRVEEIRMKKR